MRALFPDGRWKSNFLLNIGYGDPSGTRPLGPRLRSTSPHALCEAGDNAVSF